MTNADTLNAQPDSFVALKNFTLDFFCLSVNLKNIHTLLDDVSAGKVGILPGTLDEVSTGKVGCSAPAIEEEAGWAPEPVFYSSLKGS